MQEAREQAQALVAKAAAEAEALLARATAQSNAESSQEKGLETQGNAESSEGQAAALVVYSDGEEETLPEEARTSAVKRRLSFDGLSNSGSKQKSLRSFWGSQKTEPLALPSLFL